MKIALFLLPRSVDVSPASPVKRAGRPRSSSSRFVVLLGLLLLQPTFAHEGHDHGEEPKLPVAQDQAPRFEAVSEEFELVGVVQGQVLTLYLDRFASNAPVEKAMVELETGARKVLARETEAGVYRLDLADAKPGRHALVFTVQAGESSDLLTANLDIPAPKPPAAAAAFDWRRLGWAGLVLPVLGLWGWRRMRGRKNHG